MRKIEQTIVELLRNGNDGNYNLSCRDNVQIQGIYKQYALWENILFWNDSNGIFYFCGRGYPTQTTKSRLSVILTAFFDAFIYQKKSEWFLSWNNKEYLINSFDIYYFKDNKVFRLDAHNTEVLPL